MLREIERGATRVLNPGINLAQAPEKEAGTVGGTDLLSLCDGAAPPMRQVKQGFGTMPVVPGGLQCNGFAMRRQSSGCVGGKLRRTLPIERVHLEEDPLDLGVLVLDGALHAVDGLANFLGRKSVVKPDVERKQNIVGTEMHGEGMRSDLHRGVGFGNGPNVAHNLLIRALAHKQVPALVGQNRSHGGQHEADQDGADSVGIG